MIVRRIQIKELLRPNKVLILYGPRQVGKTTLVHHYLSTAPAFPGGVITQTGDDIPYSNQFSQCDLHFFRSTIPENSLLFIDEAQRIPEIGRGIKLIVDNIPGVSVIVNRPPSICYNLPEKRSPGAKLLRPCIPFRLRRPSPPRTDGTFRDICRTTSGSVCTRQ